MNSHFSDSHRNNFKQWLQGVRFCICCDVVALLFLTTTLHLPERMVLYKAIAYYNMGNIRCCITGSSFLYDVPVVSAFNPWKPSGSYLNHLL